MRSWKSLGPHSVLASINLLGDHECDLVKLRRCCVDKVLIERNYEWICEARSRNALEGRLEGLNDSIVARSSLLLCVLQELWQLKIWL